MIIGLIGTIASGKDAVIAHVLTKNFGFQRFAFADYIKECYYKKQNITEEYFKSCRGTEEENRIREGLWNFSDEMRSKYGDLYFIDPIIEKAKKYKNSIITDIRTKDEFKKVLQNKAKIIIISRDFDIKRDIEFNKDFPGTRIPNEWIFVFSSYRSNKIYLFDNDYDTLEEAREGFEKFFVEEMMDSDSFSS